MNITQQKELLTLLMELSPFEQLDVLKFVHVRRAQRIYCSRPITAREWEQLTKWQKKDLYYRVRFAKFRFEAKKYLHALLFS